MTGRPETDGRVRTEVVDGDAIGIHMDDAGNFTARTPGDEGHWTKDETLKGLLEKLRKQKRTKKLRLSIPMTLINVGRDWHSRKREPSAQAVTLTGIHARTGKALVTYADGNKGTLDSYADGTLCPRLSEDEAAAWVAAAKAKHAAEDALEALTNKAKLPGTLDAFVKDYVSHHKGSAIGSLDGLEMADNDD